MLKFNIPKIRRNDYNYYPIENQETTDEAYTETTRYWEAENQLFDDAQDTVSVTFKNMSEKSVEKAVSGHFKPFSRVPSMTAETLPPTVTKPRKIAVTVHTNGNGFELELLNGKVSIPDQQKGYIISCGCGAGKTTAIRQLICQKYHDGILYAVDTVEELEKMNAYLFQKGITDILMLHSGIGKDTLKSYYEHPELIMTHKVLLITHCRLFSDLINYFVLYKSYPLREDFDGDFQKLMSRKDLRKYIILDETPLFFKPFASIPRSALGNFADYDPTKGCFKPKSEAEMRAYYKHFIEGTTADFRQVNGLTIRKKEVLFQLLQRNFDALIGDRQKKDADFHFYTSDLVQKGMQTHVLMFEGAADILIGRQSKFELIDIPDKYCSTVNFRPFHFSQDRKEREYIKGEEYGLMLNELVEIINSSPYRSLVVVWKNIGKKGEEEWDDEGAGVSSYRDFVRDELIRRGADAAKLTVDDGCSTVTYYGAANTKSTNVFRNCRNIILMGNWSIKYDKAQQVSKAYGSVTTAREQRLWYFVQLINRTALRQHDPNITINVHYSDSFPSDLIGQLNDYLNTNTFERKSDEVKNILGERLTAKGIRKNLRTDIIALNNGFDSSIGDHIIKGDNEELRLSIPPETLYSLCSRTERKPSKYKALIESLKALNIKLSIGVKGEILSAV